MSRQKTEKLVTAILILCAVGVGTVKVLRYARPSPQTALQDFRDPDSARKRDQRMDPLILSGRRVVPLVMSALDRDELSRSRREEAVRFLGNGGYTEAIELLKEMFADSGEPESIRAEALRSIALIDRDLATEYARGYMRDLSAIGNLARELDRGDTDLLKRRTYWDALLRRTAKPPFPR